MKWTSMSASEEIVREQLDRIIARIELRLEQRCAHASALTRDANEAKKAQGSIALTVSGLRKLQMLRGEFDEPQPKLTCMPQVSGRPG
jgi:uncharacterized protein (UPF0335 family)